ncbi:MAG: hypothetical protein B7X83_08630 [Polynucleobacter sp. 17-46-58]|nr:MAG: hypothetical protein B7X83_08630 [Polynucleobacter sp. 17-46-58]
MAFGKKPDFKKKPAQNPLFKRKRYCRFTVAGVEKYQRQLDTAIKRARFLALLPFSDQHKK